MTRVDILRALVERGEQPASREAGQELVEMGWATATEHIERMRGKSGRIRRVTVTTLAPTGLGTRFAAVCKKVDARKQTGE